MKGYHRKNTKNSTRYRGKEGNSKLFDNLCKRANWRSPITVRVLNTRPSLSSLLLPIQTHINICTHTSISDSGRYVSIQESKLHFLGLYSPFTAAFCLAGVPGPTVHLPRRQALHMATHDSFSTARSTVYVVCVSDTHNPQSNLPDDDILIHAGDLTQSGSPQELQ